MIKANEFRINNYVNALGNVRQIRGISQYNQKHRTQTVVHYFEFDNCIPLKGIHLKPIPLTEEWLIGKLNFNKVGVNFIDENDFVIYTRKNGEFVFRSGKYEIVLNYVHQLQNLYFALCGKELVLNN